MALTREELIMHLTKRMLSGETINDFANAMYYISGAEPDMPVGEAVKLIEMLEKEDIVDGNPVRAWRRYVGTFTKGGENE